MFPSHLIGPVARVAFDDPLSAVNEERRLALAKKAAPSSPPWPETRALMQPAARLSRCARSLRTALRFGSPHVLRS